MCMRPINEGRSRRTPILILESNCNFSIKLQIYILAYL